MAFPTLARKNPGPALGGILCGFADRAADRVRGIQADPEKQIHRLRTDLKKLRSLLRLAEPALDKPTRKSLADKIRRLKARYASARDEAVLMALCGKLLGAPPPAEWFAAHEITRRPAEAPSLRLAASLKTGLRAVDWNAVTGKTLRKAFARTARRARKAARRCAAEERDEAFHEWRKRVKDLWYQAAALRQRAGFRKLARRAKKLSDILGDANDLSNLLLRVKAQTGAPAELIGRIEKRLRAKRRKALRFARKNTG